MVQTTAVLDTRKTDFFSILYFRVFAFGLGFATASLSGFGSGAPVSISISFWLWLCVSFIADCIDQHPALGPAPQRYRSLLGFQKQETLHTRTHHHHGDPSPAWSHRPRPPCSAVPNQMDSGAAYQSGHEAPTTWKAHRLQTACLHCHWPYPRGLLSK